jgi:hypothetical protein
VKKATPALTASAQRTAFGTMAASIAASPKPRQRRKLSPG